MSSASDPLRDPVFRRLATAYSVNELGNWLGDVALAVVVYDRTRSALATAALFLAARFVPALAARGRRAATTSIAPPMSRWWGAAPPVWRLPWRRLRSGAR